MFGLLKKKISGFVEETKIKKLVKAINEKNFIATKDIIDSITSFDSRNFLRQISNIIPRIEFNPKYRNIIYSFLGEVDFRISQGADEKVQTLALISEIISKISN